MNLKRNAKPTLDQGLERLGKPPLKNMESAGERVWQALFEIERQTDRALAEDIEAVPVGPRLQPRILRFAWVPAMAVLVVLSSVIVRTFIAKSSAPALVEVADRTLQRVIGEKYESLLNGERVGFGEVIRSNTGSGSVLVLKDGSRIEMRSKSQLALEAAEDGVRVRLDSGSVIVTAAEQRTGHLYVQTRDLTVSVEGTVFVVKAEEAGSRVAVIEGQVRVEQDRKSRELSPGEQVATNPLMELQAVTRELSWSRNAEMHLAQLREAVAPGAEPAKRLEFEVASIRVETPGGAEAFRFRPRCRGVDGVLELRNPTLGMLRDLDPTFQSTTPEPPRGRCIARRASVASLIALAYGLHILSPSDLGGPQWVHDGPGGLQLQIEAKAEDSETATKAQLQQMLQTLLAERLKLKLSWQSRELQGFVMYAGKDGSKLAEASSEEALKLVTQRVGETERRVITGKASMEDFLDFIALRPPLLGRSENDAILDRTGLNGLYAFNLVYVVPPMAPVNGEGGQRGGGRPGVGTTSPAFSNMRDALQEQLGLRLESAKIPTDIPVIEHVEKPSEN